MWWKRFMADQVMWRIVNGREWSSWKPLSSCRLIPVLRFRWFVGKFNTCWILALRRKEEYWKRTDIYILRYTHTRPHTSWIVEGSRSCVQPGLKFTPTRTSPSALYHPQLSLMKNHRQPNPQRAVGSILALREKSLVLESGTRDHAWPSSEYQRYQKVDVMFRIWLDLTLWPVNVKLWKGSYDEAFFSSASPQRISSSEWITRLGTSSPKNTFTHHHTLSTPFWLNLITCFKPRVTLLHAKACFKKTEHDFSITSSYLSSNTHLDFSTHQ